MDLMHKIFDYLFFIVIILTVILIVVKGFYPKFDWFFMCLPSFLFLGVTALFILLECFVAIARRN